MLEIPIIDTHIHLWDPGRLSYPWLREEPSIHRAFTVADYRNECSGLNVEQMIFVQAGCLDEQAMEEVEFVLDEARRDPRLTGIIAFAPLERGMQVDPLLRRLKSVPQVRGIRRMLQSEPDHEFCLQPDFLEGIRLLSKYDLHFEICIVHLQVAGVFRMVERCPEVRFILDHIGKPDIKAHLGDPWMKEIKALSRLPNIVCKISGLVTEADHDTWKPEDLKPYVDHVIDCFGFDRVLYGSDWPVAKLAATIPRWTAALEQLLVTCSLQDRRKLFHDNAVEFYRL